MPPKEKKKAEAGFTFYRNSTGQVPDIVINLIKPDLYQKGINQIREILGNCRNKNILIPFKVRSPNYPITTTSRDELPIFLMKSFDLYIVGYKIKDYLRIFNDKELRYTSETQYNFYDLRLKGEDKDANLRVTHTVGYTVAEAVRSKEIERSISQYIDKKSYSFRIDTDSVFKDKEDYNLKHDSNDNDCILELQGSFDRIENIKIADIKGDWEHESYTGAVAPEVDTISEIYRQMMAACFVLPHFISYSDEQQEDESQEDELQEAELHSEEVDIVRSNYNNVILELQHKIDRDISYSNAFLASQHKIAQNLKPVVDVMHSKIGMFCNAMFYEGSTVPAKSNGTSSTAPSSAGLYQESSSSGHYTKIPESERFTFSLSDNKPDDNDKGGGAIRTNPSSEENKIGTATNILLNYYLSWLQNLPQWLQDQILNSTPIKTLIESIKQNSLIDKPKSVAEDFYNRMLNVQDTYNHMDSIEDDINQKAQASNSNDASGMIDMTIKLTVALGGIVLILPTMIESSVDLLGKTSAFSGVFSDAILHSTEIL